jgi:hypothetical protein
MSPRMRDLSGMCPPESTETNFIVTIADPLSTASRRTLSSTYGWYPFRVDGFLRNIQLHVTSFLIL